MKCNLGKTDRIIRGIVGLAIIASGFFYGSWWGAIGILPLSTAFVGFCSLYAPLKLSTVKIEEIKKK
jgi:hypothetical protein